MIDTTQNQVGKGATPERWRKTKEKLYWIAKWVGINIPSDQKVEKLSNEHTGHCPRGKIPHKQLERCQGFLIYVARTFKSMVPYLKGLHLTLDSWRTGRDAEGFPLMKEHVHEVSNNDQGPPKFTKIVPRLKQDVIALLKFVEDDLSPKIPVRSNKMAGAYLWGDASGVGFGNSLWVEGKSWYDLGYGSWSIDMSAKSSNFREAYNLVVALERLVKENKIEKGTEVWIFTDNKVSEYCFSKGSSRSKTLHELCVLLRLLEMSGAIYLHFVWVAGTRMIEQGTDGLSRGDMINGTMAGEMFLSFVPISDSAFDWSPELKKWILDTLVPLGFHLLDYNNWFEFALEVLSR